LSPRRINNKFSLEFSKFSQIALIAAQLGQFPENFENTRENQFVLNSTWPHAITYTNIYSLQVKYQSNFDQ